jgi:hypothetical protein
MRLKMNSKIILIVMGMVCQSIYSMNEEPHADETPTQFGAKELILLEFCTKDRSKEGLAFFQLPATLKEANEFAQATIGANLSAVDKDGNTLMHQAMLNGNFHFVDVLIDRGANPYILNNGKKIPSAMHPIGSGIAAVVYLQSEYAFAYHAKWVCLIGGLMGWALSKMCQRRSTNSTIYYWATHPHIKRIYHFGKQVEDSKAEDIPSASTK